MIRRVLYRILVVGAAMMLAGQAAAQSFEEAVRSNTWLAMDLCLQVMLDRVSPAAAFGGAGFVLRSEYRGVNDFGIDQGYGHYFDAPADTVKAQLPEPDRMAGNCAVMTVHMNEPAFADVIRQALQYRYPQAEIRSATQITLRRNPSDLPLIITVSTIGTNHRYEPAGTVQVSMGFPG